MGHLWDAEGKSVRVCLTHTHTHTYTDTNTYIYTDRLRDKRFVWMQAANVCYFKTSASEREIWTHL